MKDPAGQASPAADNWADEMTRAQHAYDANKRLIEAGEKFRAQMPPPSRRPSRGGGHARKIG